MLKKYIALCLFVLSALLPATPSQAKDDQWGDWEGAYVNFSVNQTKDTFVALPMYDKKLISLAHNTTRDTEIGQSISIGYDKQFGPFVVGGMLDINHTTSEEHSSFSWTGSTDNPYTTRMDWLGSARARIGLSYKDLMVYGTAGVAMTDAAFTRWKANGTELGAFAFDKQGVVYGGGLEAKLDDNWAASVEYTHYWFEQKHPTQTIAVRGKQGTCDHLSADIIKLGLTYRF